MYSSDIETTNTTGNETMTDILRKRLADVAKLRDVARDLGDRDLYLAHDRQMGRIQALLVADQDKRSQLVLNACRQAS